MDTLIKHLGKNDLLFAKQLFSLFQTVFEMKKTSELSDPYLIYLLEKSEFIMLSALNEDKVVGGLTAYQLPMYYSEGSEMFIYDIAVHPEFQRTGIGKKLVAALKKYCHEKGIKEFFVAANEEDEHALDFYRATGGKQEKVVHFTYKV